MRFSLFDLALKNLKRKPFRTLVLASSIGLLVALVVFSLSFSRSVEVSLARASARLGADLLIVPPGARDFAEEVLLETKIKTFYMDRALMDRVRKVKGIAEVTHQTYLSSVMGLCCDIPAAKIVAFDQDTDFVVKPWLSKVLTRRINKGEIIIGRQARENFGLLDVSSSVFFNKKFDFVGVLDQTDTGLDNAFFISEENLADLVNASGITVKPGQISLIFAKVAPGEDAEQVGRRVEGEIVEVDVITRNSIGARIVGALKDIGLVFTITVVLAVLLAVSLAWSVFTAVANERAREVGIMRAVGATCRHVFRLFAMEVLVIGAIGSFAGIALGTVLSATLSHSFTLIREMSVTLSIMERIEIGLTGLALGVMVCFIGSVSSLMRLRRIDALSSLKEV